MTFSYGIGVLQINSLSFRLLCHQVEMGDGILGTEVAYVGTLCQLDIAFFEVGGDLGD